MSVINTIVINGQTYAIGGGSGLTEDVKAAMLQIARKTAYIDTDGQTYYGALYDALYPPTNLVSISAVYTQTGTVYNTDSLDVLRDDLVVTAYYDNGTSAVVTTYVLSGTLTVGTSVITAAYGGKTATFNVTVTQDASSEVLSTFYGHIRPADTTFIDRAESNEITSIVSTVQATRITVAWNTTECDEFAFRIYQYDSNGDPAYQSNITRYYGNPITDGAIYDTATGAWHDPGAGAFASIGGGNLSINLPTTGAVKVCMRRTGSGTIVTSNNTFLGWVNGGGVTITAYR